MALPPPHPPLPPLPPVHPRNTITQEAFSVAPQLLGLPLARPSRRLMAILIDLAIVAILVQAGGAFFFGIAVAFAFFRFAARALGRGDRLISRTARIAFRVMGSIILFGLAISLFHRVMDEEEEGEGRATVQGASVAASVGQSAGVPTTVTGALRLVQEFAALQNAGDSAQAHAAAVDLSRRMREMEFSDAHIRAVMDSVSAERAESKPFLRPAVAAALAEADVAAPPKPLPPDSLAILYAAALRADTTPRDPGGSDREPTAADTLAAKLASVVARDSLDELRGELGGARKELAQVQEELEEERQSGLLATLLRFLDDLGLSFGWNALYFTAFTALWKGQTPGKRLLGIRVVRLNGQPMTLWGSFERFGGYAAGLLTGLLGFAQVYWDRNRQAIHDKITETVVIREYPGVPVPPQSARPAAAQRPTLRV